MKAMLRNDLDVGMVGELPDAETTCLERECNSPVAGMVSFGRGPERDPQIVRRLLVQVGQYCGRPTGARCGHCLL